MTFSGSIGVDGDGNAYGQFESCGVRPQVVNRLKAEGIEIPPALFQRRVLVESDSANKKSVDEQE